MKTAQCYAPDFSVNMTETDGVTYSTIGPLITTSPPEQQYGNSRSSGVDILTSMGPGHSNSRSRPRPGSPVLVSPRKQSKLVEEDASGSLLEGLEEKGAGCRHGFHLTPLLLTHQPIM